MARSFLLRNTDDRESMALLGEISRETADNRRKSFGVVYQAVQDGAAMGITYDQKAPSIDGNSDGNRSPDGNQSVDNRSPNPDLSQKEMPSKELNNNKEFNLRYKRNILGINPKYSAKAENIAAKQALDKPKRYPDPDVEIARRLGSDGWLILQDVSDDSMSIIRQILWDEMLTDEDLKELRQEAAETRALRLAQDKDVA
jgi:hypothetical protein